MFKDYGHKEINFGFTMVCLVFTIPILFLFYFMVTFKNSNIYFIRDELAGTQNIEQVLGSLDAHKDKKADLKIVERIQEIGNESKLILDSDLDSYYVMHAVIINLPKLYSFFSNYLDPHLSADKKKALEIHIQQNIEEMSAGLEFARYEDKFFYGENIDLQSREYAKEYQELVHSLNENLKSSGNVKVLLEIKKHWMKNVQILRSLLVQRSDKLIEERNEAIAITLGLWASSLFLVFYFAKQVLNKQKKLYEKIESQNMKLTASSKMSALGEMAGSIAHEINTPLAVIQMRTEQLMSCMNDNTLDPITQAEALQAIDQTVSRISKIVMGLRSFARDGSKDPMVRYSMNKVIQDTFSLCKERFNNHNVRLEYLSAQDYEIDCRPVELSQVILNLLNNSYDAIQDLPDKWVKLELTKAQEMVSLSVTDSGKGIPAEIQAKIMQPFFTTKEIGKGTGLGLSISQGLINSQNGTMTLDPTCEHTRFIIKLRRSA